VLTSADVLVLQVEDGKETVSGGVSPMLIVQFITVQATFKPTVLALPLQVLSTLPGPITSLALSTRKDLASEKTAQDNESRSVKPVKEVWTLLEHLMATAPCPKIWTDEVEQSAVLAVLDAVDAGTAVPVDTRPAAVASCLAYLLGWVHGGLLGEQSAKCETVKDRDDAFAAIEDLGQVQTNVSHHWKEDVRR